MLPRLTRETAALARGFPAVCAFVNDQLNADVLNQLAAGGTRMLALRSAGFNHVALPEALRLGMTVARVPAYSPYAVAEHTVAILTAITVVEVWAYYIPSLVASRVFVPALLEHTS